VPTIHQPAGQAEVVSTSTQHPAISSGRANYNFSSSVAESQDCEQQLNSNKSNNIYDSGSGNLNKLSSSHLARIDKLFTAAVAAKSFFHGRQPTKEERFKVGTSTGKHSLLSLLTFFPF
jgi:hypothetical protein